MRKMENIAFVNEPAQLLDSHGSQRQVGEQNEIWKPAYSVFEMFSVHTIKTL